MADYIHLNPVRSGWVGGTKGSKLKEWRWSSFPQYGRRKSPDWLVIERVLQAFDLDPGSRGHRSDTAYFEERAKGRKGVLSDESLKELRRGWCLGDASFRDLLLVAMSPAARKRRRKGSITGPAARDHDEAEAEALVRKAAEILNVDARPVKLDGRGRLMEEKALLVWLVRTRTGVSNAWVSEHLRTGHSTSVSKAMRRVVESPRLLKRARSLAKQLVS